MSAATLKLAQKISWALTEAGAVINQDTIDAVITAHIREVGIPNTEPEPVVSTIQSIAPDDTRERILLEPLSDGTWQLYIPATQPGHLDEGGIPVSPYGGQTWGTLQGAVASLALAVKNGDVIFNDGRVAR